MPTKRTGFLVMLGLALYFLANQTQVGWLYIMVDGLAGLLLAAFFYARGMLKPVRVERTFHNLAPYAWPEPDPAKAGTEQTLPTGAPLFDLLPPTFYEDDPIEVTLRFSHAGLRPVFLSAGAETCPFAPTADRTQPFFIPALFRGEPQDLSYQTRCDRRGLHHCAALPLSSTGPFGLFRVKRTLPAPGDILIYPSYYPLKRLRLLKQRGFSEKQARRQGLSSEVLGTREYRPGDSLRRVHWRSTARTGSLVVKEFSDHDQLTLTVVLDLAAGGSLGQGKFSTFETAIRIAASLAYLADQTNIPFYLVGAGRRRQPPSHPLSWTAALNYLAKVDNDGHEPLASVVGRLPVLPFVVVLVSRPDEATTNAVAALARRGTQTLALTITPEAGPVPTGPRLRTARLELKQVNPYNWRDVLAGL
jgi:uncharacterized protein (DUF58 family)